MGVKSRYALFLRFAPSAPKPVFDQHVTPYSAEADPSSAAQQRRNFCIVSLREAFIGETRRVKGLRLFEADHLVRNLPQGGGDAGGRDRNRGDYSQRRRAAKAFERRL